MAPSLRDSETIYIIRFPTLKRGASDLCASGAFARTLDIRDSMNAVLPLPCFQFAWQGECPYNIDTRRIAGKVNIFNDAEGKDSSQLRRSASGLRLRKQL